MEDTSQNRQGAQFEQSGVTGFTSQDPGSNSNTRNFDAPGAGKGSTGFEDSQTGQGTTGFDQTAGRGDEAGPGGAFSADPNDNVTGFSRNSQGPPSHGAAMEAPGTGTQSTGFSNISNQGQTGFEGGQEHGATDVGAAIKDKVGQLKDKVTGS